MKTLLVSVTEAVPDKVQEIYQKVFAKVCSDSNTLVIRDVTPGITRMMDMAYRYAHLLASRSFCERVIEAQQEGFDAVVTNETLDSGVKEARELVDIPVLAPGEAALHFASLLGERIGVVTLQEPSVCRMWEKAIIEYGFQNKVITNAVRGVKLSTYEALTKGLDDPGIVLQAVEEKAKELVEQGAEVIVIGCGFYAPICTANGLVKVERDIPLVDPVAIAFKLSEVIVHLKISLGLPPLGRGVTYPRMSDKNIQRIRKHVGLVKS